MVRCGGARGMWPGRPPSELDGVAERGHDGNVGVVLDVEAPVLVLAYLGPERVQVAIHIIKTDVPDALVAVFGGVVEVETDVEPVVGGQREVVGPLVDPHGAAFVAIVELPVIHLSAVGHVGCGGELGGHGEAVAAVQAPDGESRNLGSELPAGREVQLVAVVELVVVPVRVEVGVATLVP